MRFSHLTALESPTTYIAVEGFSHEDSSCLERLFAVYGAQEASMMCHLSSPRHHLAATIILLYSPIGETPPPSPPEDFLSNATASLMAPIKETVGITEKCPFLGSQKTNFEVTGTPIPGSPKTLFAKPLFRN